jgi:hypothetical protein
VLVLLALSVLLWAPRLRGPLDVRWDGATYYILGTSLAQGKGYRLLNEPGEIEAVQYPPLLPLVVAAHQRLLGTSDFLVVGPWLRALYAALSVGFTVAVYALARLELSPRYALLAALLCALSLNTYYLSDLLYAETPFALLTTLFVIANRKGERAGYATLAALLAAAAFLLRTAGVALLAVWVAESLVRRRFRQTAVRAAVALVPVLLWQAYTARVESGPGYRQPAYPYQRAPYNYANVSYADSSRLIYTFRPEWGLARAGEMPRRVARNLAALPWSLAEAVSAPVGFWEWSVTDLNGRAGAEILPPRLVALPLAALACLVAGGTALRAARRQWFVPAYLAASVGLFCLTPWPEQLTRYLAPLTPFLAVSLVGALSAFAGACRRRLPGRWGGVGVGFGVLVVTALFYVEGFSVLRSYRMLHNPVSYHDASGHETVYPLFFYGRPWAELDKALEWVRRRADPDHDVVATTVPHTAYVRTGLRAVLPPLEADGEEARRLLRSVPVRYVVLDELPYPGISERYAALAVAGHPGQWERVYVTPGGGAQVYERLP